MQLKDVYFTWGTASSNVRYAKVIDKLKECVAVRFRDQVTVAARAMEECKVPVLTKGGHPVCVYSANVDWTTKTKNKRNSGVKVDNEPKVGH